LASLTIHNLNFITRKLAYAYLWDLYQHGPTQRNNVNHLSLALRGAHALVALGQLGPCLHVVIIFIN